MKQSTANSTTHLSGQVSARTYSQMWADAPQVPVLTIIYHPDLARIGERAFLSGLTAGREVRISRREPLFSPANGGEPASLGDEALSRKPIVVTRAGSAFCFDPSGSRTLLAINGSVVDQKSIWQQPETGLVLELSGRVVLLLHLASAGGSPTSSDFGLIGLSDGIQNVRSKISQVADLDIPVLLRGESGTGKELAAQAIHKASPRQAAAMVAVNMGGIQPELAAAEFFGSVKGAYTGALQSRKGYFSEAHGGSLFLDEIGEAPPNVQTLLLRVLETGEIQPVGSSASLSVDVRIISATDADLEALARKGAFRSPVIHRLSSFEIRIPPLRERREDIGLLLHFMLKRELARIDRLDRLAPSRKNPWFPAWLAALLVRYSWPGNVRQLGNVVRQLVITSRNQETCTLDPDLAAIMQSDLAKASEPAKKSRRQEPAEIDDDQLIQVLQRNQWELTPAAKQLGVSRPTLYKLVKACPDLHLVQDLKAEALSRCFKKHEGDLDAMSQQLRVSVHALRRRLKDMGLIGKPQGIDG